MERYTCPRELLGAVAEALAAEGFAPERPLERAVGRSHVTVLSRGNIVIALHEDLRHDTATIDVYDDELAGPSALEEFPRLFHPLA